MSKRPGDHGYPPGWCIYYRGMDRHDTCETGVNYGDLAGGRFGCHQRLPCFIKTPDEHAEKRVPCEQFRAPTKEAIAAHEKWVGERMNVLGTVLKGILPWREKHKGQSVIQTVECPACKGRLHLSIARRNGHVHGKCETQGCAEWME